MGFCAECAQWPSAQDVRNGLLRRMCAVTDLRKPVAATPPQEIMCLCVWLRRFLVLRPGEPPLSLVILARCLAGNQPSGPLREEGGGDVSLLGMRPLYFSDIQQEQHSHHL
ncbi:unnamed protein product [Pleuronectes platessa]|uniref:Uncharacterized protein n=1 Tax=Pleuronectes platessa TaxID=8262 RepID=A0A9N7U648_PLEPL|nr:unnamed protein product [Pleuronectes platessa]